MNLKNRYPGFASKVKEIIGCVREIVINEILRMNRVCLIVGACTLIGYFGYFFWWDDFLELDQLLRDALQVIVITNTFINFISLKDQSLMKDEKQRLTFSALHMASSLAYAVSTVVICWSGRAPGRVLLFFIVNPAVMIISIMFFEKMLPSKSDAQQPSVPEQV